MTAGEKKKPPVPSVTRPVARAQAALVDDGEVLSSATTHYARPLQYGQPGAVITKVHCRHTNNLEPVQHAQAARNAP